MTKDQLIATLKACGRDSMITNGGPVPLDEWTPYGLGGINGPDDGRIVWTLRPDGTVADADPLDPPLAPFVGGLWTPGKDGKAAPLTFRPVEPVIEPPRHDPHPIRCLDCGGAGRCTGSPSYSVGHATCPARRPRAWCETDYDWPGMQP